MIKNLIGEAALLEQLAEESAELSKAALKMARILRGENPTPVTLEQAKKDLQEEYTDVIHCSAELYITVDQEQIIRKQERWINRLKENVINEQRVELRVEKSMPCAGFDGYGLKPTNEVK